MAHRVCYHKDLVDLISMIKHAVKEEAPLYTAEERVNLAISRVTEGKTFTEDQRQWLERIRSHLIENLSIDQEDFDTIPVFNLSGGWGRADRVFDHQLSKMINQFNEAIAA